MNSLAGKGKTGTQGRDMDMSELERQSKGTWGGSSGGKVLVMLATGCVFNSQ